VSADITLTLPDHVLRQAQAAAQRAGRPVADFLAEAIELSLNPLGALPDYEQAMARWPDAKVLAAADARLTEAEDERLSELLYRQQAAVLTDAERVELAALMAHYQDGLLRKAQALREAVRRGLREPLRP
jgi:hypothetical protein